MSVPEALSAETVALIGVLVPALIAAVGFVARQVVQGVNDWRSERERRRARLHELGALLRASGTAFDVQRALAGRLAERLRSRHEADLTSGEGLESLFARFHQELDVDERDLHSVIRAYTEHALCPLNEAMLVWLQNDAYYRVRIGKKGDEARLADQLNQLDAHLLLWRAKYKGWIPDHAEHALVYLADEAGHGLGFPKGIEGTLARVISPPAETS